MKTIPFREFPIRISPPHWDFASSYSWGSRAARAGRPRTRIGYIPKCRRPQIRLCVATRATGARLVHREITMPLGKYPLAALALAVSFHAPAHAADS
ncbi:MAG: hypothetical protein ACXWGX_09735, partial [Usitatibacter sp.]